LFEGTDLDIQTALIEAGNKISEVGDVTTLLNKYFSFLQYSQNFIHTKKEHQDFLNS
jgi:hypothetical protein